MIARVFITGDFRIIKKGRPTGVNVLLGLDMRSNLPLSSRVRWSRAVPDSVYDSLGWFSHERNEGCAMNSFVHAVYSPDELTTRYECVDADTGIVIAASPNITSLAPPTSDASTTSALVGSMLLSNATSGAAVIAMTTCGLVAFSPIDMAVIAAEFSFADSAAAASTAAACKSPGGNASLLKSRKTVAVLSGSTLRILELPAGSKSFRVVSTASLAASTTARDPFRSVMFAAVQPIGAAQAQNIAVLQNLAATTIVAVNVTTGSTLWKLTRTGTFVTDCIVQV